MKDTNHVKVPRTRFAPSPTGMMHTGNLRTALFNFLFSLKHRGKFILRIEDTDLARSQPEYCQALLEDLTQLAIIWNEGSDRGGPYAPYSQTERMAIYEPYYQQLLANKLAYPCFCSAETLALNKKRQLANGQPPRYPGTCRHLSPKESEQKKTQGIAYTLRFHIADQQESIVFMDLVKGRQQFKASDLGDFIIRKADASPSFMFANAIDDALMQISHVLRGEDHLTNTPRQMLLLKALGLKHPEYGHISIILGQDGAPLSKRNGSCSIRELVAQGYMPLAIINYLARLGCVLSNNTSLELPDLAKHFSIEGLVRSPARFDIQQLDYWQKQAVQQLGTSGFIAWLKPVLSAYAAVPESRLTDFIRMIRDNITMPEQATFWCAQLLSDKTELPCQPDAKEILLATSANFLEQCVHAVEKYGSDWIKFEQELKNTTQFKGKALFQPIRAVLTGSLRGPKMPDLFRFLGKKGLLERFRNCLESPPRSVY